MPSIDNLSNVVSTLGVPVKLEAVVQGAGPSATYTWSQALSGSGPWSAVSSLGGYPSLSITSFAPSVFYKLAVTNTAGTAESNAVQVSRQDLVSTQVTVLSSELQTLLATSLCQQDAAVDTASWFDSGVEVRVYAGSTQLVTLFYSGWSVEDLETYQITLGSLTSRQFLVSGVPDRVDVLRGGVAVLRTSASVGSGSGTVFSLPVSQDYSESLQFGIGMPASLPKYPTLALVSSSPGRVVIEDWSTGSAVDAGTIVLDSFIRADRFEDRNLASDCRGWIEYGVGSTANLPVLDGVQFSAKALDIRTGGIYGNRSYRVMVAMRAIGNNRDGVPLVDGLFGDPRGVNHFPRAHKVRIESVGGQVLKTIEMRDGLPMNDPSLPNLLYTWDVVTPRQTNGSYDTLTNFQVALPDSKAMRPWCAAGTLYVAFFGDENKSSDATRSYVPRVHAALWRRDNSLSRAIYNGEDVHIIDKGGVNGNGAEHAEVIKKWAIPYDQVGSTPVAPNEPSFPNSGSFNWQNAFRSGWGYEPGAYGGITRRSGPGGVRVDRTAAMQEFLQMQFTSTVRPTDGANTEEIARNFALNCANYPVHYPKDMRTLDPINVYSDQPQPTVIGREVWPVQHYYGGPVTGHPAEIRIYDNYGNGGNVIASAIEASMPGVGSAMTTAKGHVRNGWMPDTEHNNRIGAAWSTLLYSDPLFRRMYEFVMLETSMSPVVGRGTFQIYSNSFSGEVQAHQFWNSRSNVLPFIHATMAWWTATQNSEYNRALIEERLTSFFTNWKTLVLDNTPEPSAALTGNQKAAAITGGMGMFWQTWDQLDYQGNRANYSSGAGWVVNYGLFNLYQMNLLVTMKASGLWNVLMAIPAAAASLTKLLRIQELNARMFAYCPWAAASTSTGVDYIGQSIAGPGLILRTQAQGAVSSDLSTIPTTIEEVIANNPALRGDEYWFLAADATPGVSTRSYVGGNYAAYSRMGAARNWWNLFAPSGAERTAALALIDSRINTLMNYTPTITDAAFVRFNFPQIVPALEQ